MNSIFTDQAVDFMARQHALHEYPKESVGYVIDGRYEPQVNISDDPENSFEVAGHYPADLDAVIHSHPDRLAEPTSDDMRGQYDTAVPWGIVSLSATATRPIQWFGDDAPIPPLIGRTFVQGITDCYSLVRDYYRTELGVTLPIFPRDPDWWQMPDVDMLTPSNFLRAGFFEVSPSDLRPGDLLLASVRCNRPNHCALYIGRGLILHHFANRLSRREPMGNWQRYVRYFLRHESQV